MPTTDLGDKHRIEIETRTDAGALVNADTTNLVITLPDDTTVNPAMVNVSTGLYRYDYPTVQAGRHIHRVVATGATIRPQDLAQVGAFNVVEQAPPYVLSLAAGKEHLNIDAAVTEFDDEVRGYLGSATAVVESFVFPVVARSFTEDVGSGGTILLKNKPCISLTSITPILGNTATYLVGDLELTVQGRLRFLNGSGFIVGPQRVVYKAGYRIIPDNYQLASQIILAHLWATQRGGGSTNVDGEEMQFITSLGYAVPRRAVQLITKRTMRVA